MDEVGAAEQVEDVADPVGVDPGEGGGAVPVNVRSRVQAEQGEDTCGVGGQVPYRPGEHVPDGRAGVTTGAEQVEPMLPIIEIGDQVGERAAGMRDGQFGGHPQGKRQPAAPRCERRRGNGFGRDAVADEAVEQGDRIGLAEQVEVDTAGAVHGDQPSEAVPTGHQHHTCGMAGQQRTDLLDRRGVVQQDKHPPAGGDGAEACGALVQARRHVRFRYAEGREEPGKRVGRRHRPVGVVAAQVDVQLPVGKPLPAPVRPEDRERGLTHSRRARHRGNHHRRAGRRVKQRVEPRKLAGPAGEPGYRHRQLCGNQRCRRCCPSGEGRHLGGWRPRRGRTTRR